MTIAISYTFNVCDANSMKMKHRRAMKANKYILYFMTLIFIVIAVLIFFNKKQVVEIDTGFKYDKQQELANLLEKAKGKGISTEESKRLDFLLGEEKRKSEQALMHYINKKKSSSSNTE